MTSTRLPTDDGEFDLSLFRAESEPDKDHLALVFGDVSGKQDVLIRVHSECFTGDVLGSKRCDCGEQLAQAMRRIADEGCGVLLYLRQEGRGIGLLQKLRAYNLQDAGYDTVEANLELGHQADERDYGIAAEMLRLLGVSSVRLMTNNPSKLEALEAHGIGVERVALEIAAGPENASYLETKVKRMRHLLELDSMFDPAGALADSAQSGVEAERGSFDVARALARVNDSEIERPAVSLSYAQSLDGSITIRSGRSLTLSCPEAMEMTHQLRARHDAILVGIDTVLADDPRLTVRLVEGTDPQPIVLDSRLRTPLESQLLADPPKAPIIATLHEADAGRQRALEAAGAQIVRVGADASGRVDLLELLPQLTRRGIESIMVEGGSKVITSFLRADVVDRIAVTITPVLVGGLGAVGDLGESAQRGVFPRLVAPRIRWVGNNLVLVAEVARQKNRADVDDDPVGLDGSLL